MYDYFHPARLGHSPVNSIPTDQVQGLEVLSRFASCAIAFLTSTAVAIDAFQLLTLIYSSVASTNVSLWLVEDSLYCELDSAPLYVLSSLLGILLSLWHGETCRGLLLGWAVGFVVASLGLLETLSSGPELAPPFWGLITLWFATLCGVTVQRKFHRFTNRHIVFFLGLIGCLSLWGKHGNLEFIQAFYPSWRGLDAGHLPGSFSGEVLIGWQQATVAFVAGFIVVVIVPFALIKSLFGDCPNRFGMKFPTEKRTELVFRSSLLLLAGLPIFYFASANPELQSHYPYIRNFSGPVQLVLFELSTLMFYASVEFVFRGYVLFGVERLISGDEREDKHWGVSATAILVSAVPYIVWHLDKPSVELFGALIWAIIAGVSAVQYRTVLHLIVIHWLWNVCLDVSVLRHLEIGFTG